MAEKDNISFDEELERVRDRLLKVNKRVKKYATVSKEPRRISEPKTTCILPDVRDISLEEMRNKLRLINDYLKRRMRGEKVDRPIELEIPVKEIVEEPTPSPIEEPEEPETESVEEETPLELPKAAASGRKKASERTGVGLDIGTSYLVAAREVEANRVFVKNERNAFLSVRNDSSTGELLSKLRIKYAALENEMYVLGNLALELANIFNRETQRSMSAGILNPSEGQSIPILRLLIENILWAPRVEKEACCFSIPAQPIDREQDTVYHRGVFEGILRNIGFEPLIVDEGYAVVLSELEYKDFTGIGVSCGGGMVNICAAFKSVPVLSFSITRGGDWIDRSAASVLGIHASRVTSLKEQGLSLKRPKTREEEAIAIYYRNYIHHFLENIAQVFGKNKDTPNFKGPVDIVFAGGASMVGDFMHVVKQEIKSVDMGFDIGNMKLADEPFTSVSRGCLFNAINAERRSGY